MTRILVLTIIVSGICAARPGAAQLPGHDRNPAVAPVSGGLSQAPEANLFVGGVTTAIPIDVPPGRTGMTPQLALTYSSGAGPSLYGHGWDLPIGRVQRRLKYGVLTCANQQQRTEFVLLLPGRTVEFSLDESTHEGVARTEEWFVRIQYVPSNNTWVVREPGGRRYELGTSRESRAGNDVGQLFAADCAHPDGSLTDHIFYTFSWELTRIEDPNGNDVHFAYDTQGNRPRLSSIAYGGNQRRNFAPLFVVDFLWTLRATDDQLAQGLGGFDARLLHRLRLIKVRGFGQVIRSYSFRYDGDSSAMPARSGRRSFLQAVTQYHGDADNGGTALGRTDTLPASTLFEYHDAAASAFGFTTFTLEKPKPAGLAQPTSARLFSADGLHHTLRDLVDINGDGFVDWVDTVSLNGGRVTIGSCGSGPGSWNVYLGSPNGFATTPIFWNVPNRSVMCVIRQERISGAVQSTDRVTVDMNGDGIADYVDATTASWQVYLGGASGFASTPTSWGAGGVSVRKREGRANYWALGYQNVTVETRGLLDLNGDGLPDVVESNDINDAHWTVWVNTGTSFAAPKKFLVRYGLIGFESDGVPVLRAFDINGDGLPDQIITWDRLRDPGTTFPGRWRVYLNTGRFIHQEPNVNHWQVPTTAGRWSLQHLDSGNRTVHDLFDINGDGLPDIVDTDGCTDSFPHWKVSLNRGAGFSPELLQWGVVTPSANCAIADRGTFDTTREVLDLDGDGLVDLVDFRAPGVTRTDYSVGGAWCGSPNGSTCGVGPYAAPFFEARADVLIEIESGVGSTTTLAYRPIGQWMNQRVPLTLWTVTNVTTDDAMCTEHSVPYGCRNDGYHTIERSFTYEGARFDAVEREFRGFATVWVREMEPTRRSALLAQGFDPGRSRVTQLRFHQDRARQGKLVDSRVYSDDGTALTALRSTSTTWQCIDPSNGNATACDDNRVWVRLLHTRASEHGSSGTRATLSGVSSWHRCADGRFSGQPAVAYAGDADGIGRRVHTHSEYLCQDNGTHILLAPNHVWRTDRLDLNKLDEHWVFYDAVGNAVRVEEWLDQTTGSTTAACTAASGLRCVRTSNEYDAYGHVVRTTDANGRDTEITYDPTTLIYPAVITTPPPFLQKVATRFDPACGTLLWRSVTYTGAIDASSPAVAKHERQYDAFCRLVATALPDEQVRGSATDANGPHVTFEYYLGHSKSPTKVVSRRREHLMSPEIDLFDALGRRIQHTWRTLAEGRLRHLTQTADYDPAGNLRSQSVPFVNTGFPADRPAGTGATVFRYDALGRVTQVTSPDGSAREVDHTIAWQTTSKDECYLRPTASCPGAKTTAIRDAFGDTTERQIFDHDALAIRTRFTYDDAGRLLITEQGTATSWNAATQIHIDYDSLGRKVFTHDPDSGDWLYGYDAVGNLAYQDDPRANQQVQFCYDRLNRLTRECRLQSDSINVAVGCFATCDEEVRHTYDDAAVPHSLGRLTRVDDPSGATIVEQYDVRGRIRTLRKRITVAGQVGEGLTRFGYDSGDRLTLLTYPDGEVVKHRYDAVGQLVSVRGKQRYVNKLTYDVFGRPRTLLHGDRTTDTWTYHDRTQNFRLKSIETSRRGHPVLSYAYTEYSPTGLLLRLEDRGPAGMAGQLDNTSTYTYDGLGRLSGASGPNLPYASGPTGYDYDAFGNLRHKEGTVLEYDALRPHRLARLNGVAAGIAHDDNGNRTARPPQIYEYDSSDQLTRVTTSSGQSVQFAYDHAGQRVTKITPVGITRYYSDLAEVTGSTLTKHYYAAGMRIASQRVENALLVGLSSRPAVEVDQAPGGHAIILRLSRTLQTAAVMAWLLATLLLTSVRRLRVPIKGFAAPRGVALLLAVVVGVTSTPLPILVRPVQAAIIGTVTHYHLDHLGSTQLLTTKKGVVAHVRYKPYGEVRGYFDELGAPLPSAGNACVGPSCFEFTTYDSEPVSGLQYAGARMYDPQLGMFLTHDPLRQFANPYSYAGWNPANFTDPGGAYAGPPPYNASGAVFQTPAACPIFTAGPCRFPNDRSSAGSFSSGPTATHTVEIPNPWKDCIGDRCLFKLSGSGKDTHRPGPAKDIARAVAEALAAQFVPGAGEIGDALVVFGSGYATWERGIAAVSLLAGTLSAGVAPNAGPLLRAARVARSARSGFGEARAGQRVYRVFGADARALGRYWTRQDPHGIRNYREVAGLPSERGITGYGGRRFNSGGFVVSGRIVDPDGITLTPGGARSLHGNSGGIDEIVVPNPASQIEIEEIYGVNPPF